MDTREIRYRPDWPSRVLAFFSLLVAALAVGYLAVQGQVDVRQDALVKRFDEKLTEQVELHKPQLEGLVADMRQSATDIKAQAKAGVDQFLTDSTARVDELLRDKTDEYGKVADLNEQRLQELESKLNRLTVARVDPQESSAAQSPAAEERGSERPSTDGDVEIEVTNSGTEDMVIDRLRFVPSQVVSTREWKLTSLSTRSTTTDAGSPAGTIVLTDRDNLSASTGNHGVYDHRLTQPLTLRPGEMVAMRLAIRNARHKNWALVGDLTFYHEQTEVHRLDNVAAPFLSP